MTSAKEQEAIRKLLVFLQEWDHAHKAARSRILDNFIKSNDGKTEPELELEFSQGASLFLARLAAWLRMTYLYTDSTCLNKLLKSIGIFLSAASGRRYLIEFLEVGGVSMLLEMLGLNHLKEEDKRESVKLLQLVADAGRKYKELICESYGVRSLTELLATCSSAEVQDEVQVLLDSLGRGNPKYRSQVYKGLVAVLPCGSPRAQQLALQTLRGMQDPVGEVGEGPPALPEPLLAVLGSGHLEVQHQVQSRRVSLRHVSQKANSSSHVTTFPPFSHLRNVSKRHSHFPDVPPVGPTALCLGEPVPAYVQQAAAAKAIGMLAKESAAVAEEPVQLKAMHSLMVAVGNQDHALSQRHASISLEYFVRTSPFVEDLVRKAVGPTLFQLLKDSPETWYTKIDPGQAEELASSMMASPKDMARMQPTAAFSGLLNTAF
ncbi:ARMD1 protein, partial [Alectura lathami]|nr:ARMD1 protein [Alectura lathami]